MRSSMVVNDTSDITSAHVDDSHNEMVAEGIFLEVSTRMELDLAYCSEKVLNLEILTMQVSDIANDYEILMKDPEELLTESIEKAFQFDILSGYLYSEVKEIENFMSCLLQDIMESRKKFTESDHQVEDSLQNTVESLQPAEESLKISLDQVADIKIQSANFEKTIAFGIPICKRLENGECSPMNSKWKLQTVDQQRHLLISLEKSLAREMDFEKKLSESRYNEEELKIKLQFAEKNAYCIEELIEEIMVKMLTAENFVEVLLGNSRDFLGKLQHGQFNFSTSTTREGEVKTNLEKGFMKLSSEEDDQNNSRTVSFGLNSFSMPSEIDHGTNLKESMAASSEALTLRERVIVLKEQLKQSESQLQLIEASVRDISRHHNILYPEPGNSDDIIKSLKEYVLGMQSRAESAEAQSAQLMKDNVELNVEAGFLRNDGVEKANFFERKLKESNMQLEHANASVEATEENQKMLYTSLTDMEHLIEDLKGKVYKAENRADIAEDKCILLTDTNLELNEELSFLRARLESSEASLHQAHMQKIATVKDIGNRTRIIIELVKKLAFERERLQLQISVLTNRNKILLEKFLRSESNIHVKYEKVNITADHGSINSKDENVAESLSTRFQDVDELISSSIYEMKAAEEPVPNIEQVRTIDATQLSRKYIFIAFILLLLSILSLFLFQLDILNL